MTLVDLVMAVAILGIMAGGIFGSFRYGFFTLQLVRENQRATQVLLEVTESIRLYSWEQVNSNGFIPSSFTNVYDPQATDGNQGATYIGQVLISPSTLSSSYAGGLRELTVTLNWTTRDIPHTRSLKTFIARDGIQNYVY